MEPDLEVRPPPVGKSRFPVAEPTERAPGGCVWGAAAGRTVRLTRHIPCQSAMGRGLSTQTLRCGRMAVRKATGGLPSACHSYAVVARTRADESPGRLFAPRGEVPLVNGGSYAQRCSDRRHRCQGNDILHC